MIIQLENATGRQPYLSCVYASICAPTSMNAGITIKHHIVGSMGWTTESMYFYKKYIIIQLEYSNRAAASASNSMCPPVSMSAAMTTQHHVL